MAVGAGPAQQAAALKALGTLLDMVAHRRALEQNAAAEGRKLSAARNRLHTARLSETARERVSWRLDAALQRASDSPASQRDAIDRALRSGDLQTARRIARQHGPDTESECIELGRVLEQQISPSKAAQLNDQISDHEHLHDEMKRVLEGMPSLDDLRERITRLVARLPDEALTKLAPEQQASLDALRAAWERGSGIEI
jgi:hypothetical protein